MRYSIDSKFLTVKSIVNIFLANIDQYIVRNISSETLRNMYGIIAKSVAPSEWLDADIVRRTREYLESDMYKGVYTFFRQPG